jgi:diguanylate cyclase (GGDEF)-like protein
MNLKKKIRRLLSSVKLRAFHLIMTGVSLVILNIVLFLLFSFFFNFFSEQIALAASKSVESLGIAEDVYLAILESANDLSTELTLWIIAILASGMVLNFVFYDLIILKFIINPLHQIDVKANRMIDDQNHLRDQIEPPMFKELQEVANTFNKMSQEIKFQMQTLEEQVQQRTKELESAKENIEHLANHDALTGLPNRRLFNEHASQAVKLGHRKKTKFSLLMIDLNQFKKINDTYGHMVGDQVLKEVAKRFKEGLRDSDLISRWGGDEFAILAFDINNKSDVVKIITRVFNVFDRPIEANGRYFNIEMSIGAAIYPNDGENQRVLFHNADDALYLAKRRQSPRAYCFYQDDFKLGDNGLLDI